MFQRIFFQSELPPPSHYKGWRKWSLPVGQIETDAKSLNSVSATSGHSRRSSDTSQLSLTSGESNNCINGDETQSDEDIWNLWNTIISEWETFSKKKANILKDLVRKGIPKHFRGIVWQLLAGARDSPLKNEYCKYIKMKSPCEKVIRRDIARTYPEHDFFKEKDGIGQESLFNVMKAYSLEDREVGYCQGSAFIVGLLLMQQMPEEEVFCTFVRLMKNYRLREMFKPTMSELGLCMYQLECLVQELVPELHIHFQAQSFYTSMYASSWFLTLFTTSLSLPLACRIMDVFLLEGIEVIFRVAIAILLTGRDKLLQLDMEGMLRYFQKEMPTEFESDPDNLLHVAFNIKYNAKKMKKLEKDYTVMKTKEQEDQVELRRLRTENRLLRHRNDTLERESAELADKLIQDQVNRAEEQESTFEIQRELLLVKERDNTMQLKLKMAEERIRKLSVLPEEEFCRSSFSSSTTSEIKDCPFPTTLPQPDIIQQKEELVQCLQGELVKVRLKDAENEALIRDLRHRIQDLEEDKKQLRESTPDYSTAKLEEELMSSKLRENGQRDENELLRSRLTELREEFEKYVMARDASSSEPSSSSSNQPESIDSTQTNSLTSAVSTPARKLGSLFTKSNSNSTSTKEEMARLETEVLSLRFKETEADAEFANLRQQVMDLEAKSQVSWNHAKRADEELKKSEETVEELTRKESQLVSLLKEQERRYDDLQGKLKEELMLARIRDAENLQRFAELTQKISNLEFKNEELTAEGEIIRDDESDNVKDLQDRVSELKAEILRLQHANRKLSLSFSLQNLRSSISLSESEEDLRLKLPQTSPDLLNGVSSTSTTPSPPPIAEKTAS